MKNLRRLTAAMSAFAMAAAMTTTAFAQEANETTIEPKGRTDGSDTFDVTPNPETADATVEFGVDPDYMVVIPTVVELEGTRGSTYTKTAQVKAYDVMLEKGQSVRVDITSASKFKLSAGGGYQLPYTVSTVAFGEVNKDTGGIVAVFGTSTEEQTAELTFTTDNAPEYAGRYTDPVVFNISIQTIS